MAPNPQCLEITRPEPYFGCESWLPAAAVGSSNPANFSKWLRVSSGSPHFGGPAPQTTACANPHCRPPRTRLARGLRQRYQPNVYGLLECPPLPQAVYLLVHRQPNDSSSKALDIAPALNVHPRSNLARFLPARRHPRRHRSPCPPSCRPVAEACRTIACDLRAGLFGSLGAEPSSPATPARRQGPSPPAAPCEPFAPNRRGLWVAPWRPATDLPGRPFLAWHNPQDASLCFVG